MVPILQNLEEVIKFDFSNCNPMQVYIKSDLEKINGPLYSWRIIDITQTSKTCVCVCAHNQNPRVIYCVKKSRLKIYRVENMWKAVLSRFLTQILSSFSKMKIKSSKSLFPFVIDSSSYYCNSTPPSKKRRHKITPQIK